MSSNEGESEVEGKKEKKHKCCCPCKDCMDLSAKIASRNDESVQVWKGNLIRIIRGDSAASRCIFKSVCTRFGLFPESLLECYVAQHQSHSTQ